MKVFLGCLLCLFSVIFNYATAQNLVVSGFLYEANSSNAIPYANIIDITNNKSGTTSRKNGSFELVLPEGSKDHKIFISCVGYRDTTLTAGQLIKHEILYLEPDVYTMPEVVVSSKPLTEIEIGNSKANISREATFEASAGFSWGAYIQTKKKEQNGYVNTLNFYIGEDGFPQAPIALKVLKFRGKFRFRYQLPRSQFKDMLPEPVILTAENSGWVSIDLSEYNLVVPESGLFFLFTPLDEGNQYKYETPYGIKYGASMGKYANKKDARRIYPLFQWGKHFGVLKKTSPPAVSVVIFKEK